MNIPYYKMPEGTSDCFGNKASILHPPLIPNSLCQWRTLMYCTTIRDVDSHILERNVEYIIQFKMFENSDTKFHFSTNYSEHMRKSRTGTFSASPSPRVYNNQLKGMIGPVREMRINQMRIHYLFSIGKNLASFVNETKIQISLFVKDKLIAQGSFFPFKNFDLYLYKDIESQSHKNVIYLFTEGMKQLEIEIKTGICCDNVIDTSTFSIHKLASHDVYYPEDCYYNANLLPVDWIKLIDPNYGVILEEEPKDTNEEIVPNYRSTLTRKEFKEQEPAIRISMIDTKDKIQPSEFEKEFQEFRTLSAPSTPLFRKDRKNSLNLDRPGNEFGIKLQPVIVLFSQKLNST